MKSALVAIGIDKTGDLPKLHAAASGAEEIAAWARLQKMDVACLTDANGPITLAEIQAAVRALVDTRTYNQLIIYFSGHGVLRAPGAEVWLLSNAPHTPTEAVNVAGSIWNARNAGVPHVVFISDACRSLPQDLRSTQVSGGEIFPSASPRAPRPDIDSFYATLPGDPALEVNHESLAPDYRGIFTQCLMRGLRGEVTEVVESHGDGGQWVIRSRLLKQWLARAVPDAASAVSIKLVQHPEIQVESAPPTYLSKVATPATLPLGAQRSSPPVAHARLALNYSQRDNFLSKVEGLRKLSQKDVIATLRPQLERVLSTRGRPQFETQTGFTVFGARLKRVMIRHGAIDVLEEGGQSHVRISVAQDAPSATHALLELQSGKGVGLAVLPGYVGTVLVEEGRVVNVNYTPSRNSEAFADYERVSDEIEGRRAFAAAAARNGLFRLAASSEMDIGLYLRAGRAIDPTLAIYAAYAFAQSGDTDGIRDVYAQMKKGAEAAPMPFDIALLAGALSDTSVTPPWPLLTQGWSLLKKADLDNFPAAREAGRFLVAGLWTTFAPDGLSRLWQPTEADHRKEIA